MSTEETLILKPDEVARRRSESVARKQVQEIESEEIEPVNTAGLVKIVYESQGRFGTPTVLYFDDYNATHINNIELSTQDNLLENLIVIFNELKKNEPDFDVKNMTAEDLLETLIAIKQQFEGNTHIHYWVCGCQSDKSDKDRIVNEYSMELSTLQYKSMTQIDEEMKLYLKERFDDLTDEEFKTYLLKKYKNDPLDDIDNYTREEEISKVVVKEPFHIIADNDVYTIRYPRLEDVLKAKKFADRLYAPKIKSIENRKEANVELHKLKEKKQAEIETLKEEQARTLVLYAKSMMLISKNNKVLSDAEKYEEFKSNLKRKSIRNIEALFDNIQFGLSTEIELICPICGESEKRLLRDSIDPRQLLPLSYKQSNKGNASEGKSKFNSGFDIYFGI